jgi:hypothetical protein
LEPALILRDSCPQSAAYPKQIVNLKKLSSAHGQQDTREEKLMSASASAEKLAPVTLAATSEGKHSAAKGSTVPQHAKNVHIDGDAERMRSTLHRMTSNSVDELDGLFSELQEVRDFLKSEGERVQREIANYAQLNQSALAAIKIITETIGPWKNTTLDSDPQSSGSGVAPPVAGLPAHSPANEQTRS